MRRPAKPAPEAVYTVEETDPWGVQVRRFDLDEMVKRFTPDELELLCAEMTVVRVKVGLLQEVQEYQFRLLYGEQQGTLL